jgi:hypothetical protein
LCVHATDFDLAAAIKFRQKACWDSGAALVPRTSTVIQAGRLAPAAGSARRVGDDEHGRPACASLPVEPRARSHSVRARSKNFR